MEEMLVSVIIPVRNGERFVGRTLDSALAQTYRPLEIVVVDDGSTDQTSAIVEAAAARCGRIRLFRGSHAGMSAARNLAISQSRGGLIAPLDADDLWYPEKIARQVGVMRASSPSVGVVYCWTVDIDEDDLIIPPIRDKCIAQGNVIAELAAGNILESGSVPLIRRSYLDAIGGYDSNLKNSADWKLNLALAEICEFAVVPSHLVGYRRWSTNSSNNTMAMERSIDQVERWIIDKWPDLPTNARRQMLYNSNYYLAHKALTTNNFITAARYYLKSLKADPSASLSPLSLMLGARFVVRVLGIKRRDLPFQASPIPFKDFQPKLEVEGKNNMKGFETASKAN
jgi:glycosyltransferase involved in cell wall biosynthesis